MRHSRKTALIFGFVAATVLPSVNASAQAPAQASAKAPEAPHKVAVVDVARILKDHPGIQQQRAKVEQSLKDYDAQLQTKREELKRDVELLKTFAADSPEYRAQEEKIASNESNLRLEMARKRKELVDAEARIYYDNYQMIANAVRQLAVHNNIDLVLRFNGEEMDLENQESVVRGVMKNIVYRSDRLDLTDMTMKMMDAMIARANQTQVRR